MKILIENAGAPTGFLILRSQPQTGNEAGEWVIEASGEVNADKVTVLQSIPIDQHLPASIINYVTRTRETIVKNDAAQQGKFTNDPYIKANKTKSILCAPLLNQGQLSGIVYLENNLTTGAFTPDRLEVIQLLSGQAAIAIENAQLYNNLEQKVSDRTQELAQALDDLKATQDELIQSAKMAALGQLIAGIAHEVNTPLGAIRSSAESVSQFLSQTLKELPTVLQSLGSEEVENFLALLQKSLDSESNLSAKEERKLKRALISQLEDEEIEDADDFADTLIDMGIYQEVEPFLPLLKRPDGLQILELAYKVTELQEVCKRLARLQSEPQKLYL